MRRDEVRLLAPPEFPGHPDPGSLYQLWHALDPVSSHRSVLRAVMITTLDGASSVHGRSGPMGTPTDHLLFHVMRARADAVVVGARTALIEEYGPPGVDPRWAHLRADPEPPRLVLVTTEARPPLLEHLETVGADRMELVMPDGAPGEREARSLGARVHPTDGDPARGLRGVLERTGAREVSLEGGPSLLGALVAADAVDELVLTLAPRLDVSTGSPGLVADGPASSSSFRAVTAFTAPDGGLYTRWARNREDA